MPARNEPRPIPSPVKNAAGSGPATSIGGRCFARRRRRIRLQRCLQIKLLSGARQQVSGCAHLPLGERARIGGWVGIVPGLTEAKREEPVSVSVTPIGTHDGEEVREANLTSDSGVSLAIIGYGGRVRDWRVPVGGAPRPVVLGFENWQRYVADSTYFGAIAGRVANRIGNSRFTLGGREYQLEPNEGQNQLHGGPGGLSKRVWTLEPDSEGNAVRLAITSAEGDMGYPGSAEIEVVYALAGNRVSIAMTARVSETTPINLVQHHYFNLAGEGDVLGHRLQVEADRFTPVDDELIPTGEIAEVAGTENDFTSPRTILEAGGGKPRPYDLNLVLKEGRDVAAPAVTLKAPDEALTLRLWTGQPGVQFYNGAYLDGVAGGLDGRTYPAFGGMCLEDQGFPDAPNHSNFPSILVTPDADYEHRLEIEIG